jgi:hypothetical protein
VSCPDGIERWREKAARPYAVRRLKRERNPTQRGCWVPETGVIVGSDMQLSASRNAVVKEHARLAPEYERRWSFYVRVTSRETLARLRINPTDSVLDVGCGTGGLLC